MEGQHVTPPPPDRYLAAVCRNGHISKDFLDPPIQRYSRVVVGEPPPSKVPRYCGECGAPVLTVCPSCQSSILGARVGSTNIPLRKPESFCWGCGEALPWATREERVAKLYDIIDFEDVDEATLLTVREQIAVLSAPVDEETDERRGRALERLKGLVPKAYEAMLPVLQGIATAELKRRLKVE
jgi:hypothetical protein